ncbi:hypothetical protein RCL1_002400 [Eukaryota sp. TZLM3-RCL]
MLQFSNFIHPLISVDLTKSTTTSHFMGAESSKPQSEPTDEIIKVIQDKSKVPTDSKYCRSLLSLPLPKSLSHVSDSESDRSFLFSTLDVGLAQVFDCYHTTTASATSFLQESKGKFDKLSICSNDVIEPINNRVSSCINFTIALDQIESISVQICESITDLTNTLSLLEECRVLLEIVEGSEIEGFDSFFNRFISFV